VKTVYEVWFKPDANRSYERQGDPHESLFAAQRATPFTTPEQWRWANMDEKVHVPDDDHAHQNHGFWMIAEERSAENDADRMELAVDLALEYGQIDGSHHKTWVIDQMVRVLVGDRYDEVIAEYQNGDDGPETYTWDEGTAP
jgi:hypothetical protein